jgi:DNA-directed RNA polymerase subunit N (RpoN/RPB10)
VKNKFIGARYNMGLITKTTMLTWYSSNKKWFENKGYNYTKIFDDFEIKVEDLQDNSHYLIDIQCDDCGETFTYTWQAYLKNVQKDNKIYCKKCKAKKDAKWMSFEEWCLHYNKQDVLERWYILKNNCKPNDISFSSKGFNKEC